MIKEEHWVYTSMCPMGDDHEHKEWHQEWHRMGKPKGTNPAMRFCLERDCNYTERKTQ